MIIRNGLVFTEEGKFKELTITTATDKIYSLTASASANTDNAFIHSKETSFHNIESIDASDCYVIPGLIDIHFHGCNGVDFCDIANAGSQEEADAILQKIASYELSQGITAICPTTMSIPMDNLIKISRYSANYATQQPPFLSDTTVDMSSSYEGTKPCADFVGIYLEGPFLSPRRCGAQNKESLNFPDYGVLERLSAASNDLIRVVAVAPELTGAMDFIKAVNTYIPHITCSLAHTDADYNTAYHAFEAGASQVTHLFNAMPPLHHRNPGVIGAAFDTPHCNVECICDGIHLAPSIIRASFQLFGAERIILISDSTMATGMPDGQYHLGNQNITVHGKLATLADGTIAGSCSNLMDCVRTAVAFGIPLEDAIRAATLNPARAIGVDSLHGSIAIGKYANLVLLDKDTLALRKVIYHGKLYT